jgi:hypothetical protein
MVLLEGCSNTWSDRQNVRVAAAPLLRVNAASGGVGALGQGRRRRRRRDKLLVVVVVEEEEEETTRWRRG